MNDEQIVEDKSVPSETPSGEVERFTATERTSMRNTVLNWLKVHKDDPVLVNGKPAVVVPLQSKRHSWWSRSKPRSVASVAPNSSQVAAPVVSHKAKLSADENVRNDQATVDIKPIQQSASVWPPIANVAEPIQSVHVNIPATQVEEHIPKPVEPIITPVTKETKLLPSDDTDLLDELDEKLLTVGGGEINGEQHEKIVEEVEEYEENSRHQVKLDNKKNDASVDSLIESVVVPRLKKRWQVAVSISNIYRACWAVWIIMTIAGVMSTSLFSYEVARAFSFFTPVPYAIVGNTPVFLATFDKELQALKTFQSQQVGSEVSSEELKQQVEIAVVRRHIATALSAEEQIWIKQSAVQQEVDAVVEKAGSIEQVENTVRDLWGWTLSDYRRYIVQPMLVKRALQEKLSEDSVLALEVGQVGNITQFDRYLDAVSADYRIVFFQK